MADVDIDALCAELDNIIDQPTNNNKNPNSKAAKPSVLSSYSKPTSTSSTTHPSSSFAHSTAANNKSQSSKPTTQVSAFDLSDSDEEQDQRIRQPTNHSNTTRLTTNSVTSQLSTQSRTNPPITSNQRTTGSKPSVNTSGGFDSDDDLNSLLADMDSVIDKSPIKASKINLKPAPTTATIPNTTSTRTTSKSSSSSSSFGSGSKVKCYPPILTNGSNTASTATSCSALLCIACDQRVISLPHARWKDEIVDYMFFRNHYPDTTRMSEGVIRDTTSAAYACACSWQSVGPNSIGASSLDLSQLRDSDRRSKSGCSDWTKLKWSCTGH